MDGLYIEGGESLQGKTKQMLAGVAAGTVGGLFGGGGGSVLLSLLAKWGGVEGKNVFALTVASILPMSCVSAAVYLTGVRPEWTTILPCLLGGAAGGLIAGLTFEKVGVRTLRLVFGLFLLYGGVRYLV